MRTSAWGGRRCAAPQRADIVAAYAGQNTVSQSACPEADPGRVHQTLSNLGTELKAPSPAVKVNRSVSRSVRATSSSAWRDGKEAEDAEALPLAI